MSEDKLEKIFELQQNLDKLVGFTEMSYQEKINNNFMALLHEWTELHDETNWKHWKKTKKSESIVKKLEEYADIIHFIVQRALIDEFSAKDIFDAYIRKNETNQYRVQNNY